MHTEKRIRLEQDAGGLSTHDTGVHSLTSADLCPARALLEDVYPS